MKTRNKRKSRLPKPTLPSQQEFDPWGGCLDAQCAWKNFGGLDVDTAYAKFCENPLHYQEDFMFMGPKAFRFYFPVVDRYLRNARDEEDGSDDCQAWILAHALQMQIEQSLDEQLLESISDLCKYVRSHLSQYASTARAQKRIDKAWLSVEKLVTTEVT